jgi:hypothetical protein
VVAQEPTVIDQASAAASGACRATSRLAKEVLGAGPGVDLDLGAGGAQGGHEPLVELRGVELVGLGPVEEDRAVDPGRVVLVAGGVVDGRRGDVAPGRQADGVAPAQGPAEDADRPPPARALSDGDAPPSSRVGAAARFHLPGELLGLLRGRWWCGRRTGRRPRPPARPRPARRRRRGRAAAGRTSRGTTTTPALRRSADGGSAR